MYVCLCYGVTEHDVRQEIACGARDPAAVAAGCGAGASCGGCLERICALLRDGDRIGDADSPMAEAAGF